MQARRVLKVDYNKSMEFSQRSVSYNNLFVNSEQVCKFLSFIKININALFKISSVTIIKRLKFLLFLL